MECNLDQKKGGRETAKASLEVRLSCTQIKQKTKFKVTIGEELSFRTMSFFSARQKKGGIILIGHHKMASGKAEKKKWQQSSDEEEDEDQEKYFLNCDTSFTRW